MNKRSRAIFFPLALFPFMAFGQTEPLELKVTLKPYKNQWIYLGYHYGKQKPILDSARLDENSTVTFRKDKPIEKGVYLVGFPGMTGYFELLIDKDQQFSVSADTSDILGTLKFEGSKDNELFLTYQKFSAARGSQIEATRARLSQAKTAADTAAINAELKKLGEEVQAFRADLIKNNPDATITALLNAMKDPVVPPAFQHPGGKYDSTFAYRYFKSHYWDDAYFFDERLVRTSFFEPKLDQYFEQLVYPNPDSVIREIDWMLGYASNTEEMQKFLLIKFVNRYLNQKFMWEDRVFVHLFEKYFSQKSYPWLNERAKKTISDRAYSLMANLFGTRASDIEAKDSTGKLISLYSIADPYTLVVFWDPTCGHCKETIPRIDSMYRAKWKQQGVRVFAVSKESDGDQNTWKKFISDHELKGWVNVYYSKADERARVDNNIPGYMQLYDVQTVPTLYLLDKEKRILAKKLTFDQIDQVLQVKNPNK